MIVKTRKQGNSLMITIPKNFNIPTGKEYEANITSNGELVFIPKEQGEIKFATNDEIYEDIDQIFEEYDGVFKELVDK